MRDHFKKMLFIGSVLAIFLTLSTAHFSYAEVGVTDDLIKIGTSMDLSGPHVFYGKGYMKGINAVLQSVNEEGGINGRKLKVIAYDSKYEPSRAVSNFKKLVYDDKVFCLLQIYGTPPTLAMLPLVLREKIPLIAPSTSSIQVAIPPKRYVFPVWPLLHYYGRVMIDYAVEDCKCKSPRVAFMHVDTEFGMQQVEGAKDQAKKYGFKILDAVPYKSTSVDFSSLLLRMRNLKVDYLFAIGSIKDTASIIIKIKEMGWTPNLIGMTSSVNQSMLNLAGDAAEWGKGFKAFYAGNLSHEDIPGSREYRALMAKYHPAWTPDEISFHAFGAANLMVEGLRRAGKDLTREGLVEAMETLKGFRNGFNGPVTYAPNKREGTSALRLVKAKDGKFHGISDWIYPKFFDSK